MLNDEKTFFEYNDLLQIINRGPGVTIIWRNNPDVSVCFVSDNINKITGYSSQEFLSGTVTLNQIIHPDDLEKVQNKRETSSADAACDEYELTCYRILSRGDELKYVNDQTFIKRDEFGKIIHYQIILLDITDRRKHEESLRISQYSLDKAAIGAFCLNPAGEIYNVNDEAARMLGYTREELESLCLFDIDPMVTSDNYDEIWQILVDNGANSFESFHRKKDGTTIPVEIHANILEYEGKIFSISFSKDISKRKQAEKALQDNLVQLQAVYKNLPITLWATDENGVFTLSEGLSLKKQNLNPGELVGKSVYDSYKDYPEIIENLKRVHQGESCEYEVEVQGIIYQSFLTPIFDEQGKVKGTSGIAIDVTDKRKAEEELLHLQSYLTNIINSMPSIIIGVNSRGCITQWNKTAEDCTDISSEKACGEKLSTILPQLEPEMVKIENSIENGEIVQEHKRSATIDKNAHYEEMTIYPLLSSSTRGAVIRIDDVTDQVNMEKKVFQTEKLSSIGSMAAGITHDLNNLLTPILGFSELLFLKIEEKEEGYSYVKQIKDAAEKAKNLVGQLLSFTRQAPQAYSHIDLNQVVKDFLQLLRRTIREDIEIRWEKENEIAMINGDRGQLEQIIMNLAINSQFAMPDGGTLTIRTEQRYIETHEETIGGMKPGLYNILIVEDTGSGMDKETQMHIFNPFFSTKGSKGNGLGLATIYGIVKQHDGNIRLYSEPGLGTIFRISFPALDDADYRAGLEEIRETKNRDGIETILIAEDNYQVRELTKTILEHSGYKLLVASNGQEAIDKIMSMKNEGDPIHLLLTDLIMPEINGRDLYKQAKLEMPELKVLFMSGYSDIIADQKNPNEKSFSIIQKPFSLSSLTAKVREILDKKEN
ncbi:MAG: PAS domain S-box protein [Spirochaetes bacterium]|nr:PAS domain S-box protein [Bacteroidales bacterium]MBN2772083.1 PAS domain S-box protein [Spirochaetota bacterium]